MLYVHGCAGIVTASTPEREGGARCVSSARRDLWEGRGEILVRTAATADQFGLAPENFIAVASSAR
jgi:hypothetical protein